MFFLGKDENSAREEGRRREIPLGTGKQKIPPDQGERKKKQLLPSSLREE